MISIFRTLTVAAPPETVLAYLKDFGNTTEWEPATRQTVRNDTGPLVVGANWYNTAKVRGLKIELTYTLQAVESDRLIFAGRGEGATSTGTMTVRPVPGGTELTYHLELEMHGLAKLTMPVLRIEFEKLGNRTAVRLTEVLNRLERSDISG